MQCSRLAHVGVTYLKLLLRTVRTTAVRGTAVVRTAVVKIQSCQPEHQAHRSL